MMPVDPTQKDGYRAQSRTSAMNWRADPRPSFIYAVLKLYTGGNLQIPSQAQDMTPTTQVFLALSCPRPTLPDRRRDQHRRGRPMADDWPAAGATGARRDVRTR